MFVEAAIEERHGGTGLFGDIKLRKYDTLVLYIYIYIFTYFSFSSFSCVMVCCTYIPVSPHIYTSIVNLFALGLSPAVDFAHSH